MAPIGPTSDAAEQHSYRVFHTVQASLGNHLPATLWGYKLINGLLLPVPMTKPPAPEYLLRYLRLVACS